MNKLETREPESFLDGPIDGAIFRELKMYTDQRGWLIELFRDDEVPANCNPVMAYVSQTLPGVAHGPHSHVDQTDYFAFVGPGEFTMYLWDIRVGSPSWGRRMAVCLGESKKTAVVVPPGVVHAYKNTGSVPGWVFNAPNRLYAGESKREKVDEVRHEDRVNSPYRLEGT